MTSSTSTNKFRILEEECLHPISPEGFFKNTGKKQLILDISVFEETDKRVREIESSNYRKVSFQTKNMT